MANELAQNTASNTPLKSGPSLLMDPVRFEHVQRIAKVYAMSPLFPEHLRKGGIETAVANAILVINMADRLSEEALTVAQNIYFVSGKPGWSSTYLIAKANQHGVFKDPIDWKVTGSGDTLSLTAFGVLLGTGKRVEFTCDMAMAKAEGWTKNSKYKSMPEVMLRYRSAAFLIRFYCPEILIGVPAQVEVELTTKDVTPGDYVPTTPAPKAETKAVEEAETVTEPEAVKETLHDEKTGEVTEDSSDGEAAADLEQFKNLVTMIVTDLQDGATVEQVTEIYGPQIEGMKAGAPTVYADLLKEFEAFAPKD